MNWFGDTNGLTLFIHWKELRTPLDLNEKVKEIHNILANEIRLNLIVKNVLDTMAEEELKEELNKKYGLRKENK